MIAPRSLGLLMGISLMIAAGCTAASRDDAGESEGRVVGVTDLSRLEVEFGLTKDAFTDGHWQRPDAVLQNGACYQKTVGAGPGWEFRRYVNGAAFFAKLGTAPATGDKRPVVCVDVDIDGFEGPVTVSVDGFGLDAALRYHFGRPGNYQGAAGHSYRTFVTGSLEVADPSRFCGLRLTDDVTVRDPVLRSGAEAIQACKAGGGTDEVCFGRGMEACEAAAERDIARDTIDKPSLDGEYVYFVMADVGQDNMATIDSDLASVVYRYAWRAAESTDIYTLADDPVGTYVDKEGADDMQTVHFEHLDAHRVHSADKDVITITPKSSTTALVTCTRPLDAQGPLGEYQCSGL